VTTFLHEWISSWSVDPFFDVQRHASQEIVAARTTGIVFFLVLEEPREKKGNGATVEERKIERPSIFRMESWCRTTGRANLYIVLAK
jgi:hypothetical protein